MSFSKKELDEFIKDNPQHKKFLLSFYDEKVKTKTDNIQKKMKLFDQQKKSLLSLGKHSKRLIKCKKPILSSPSFSLRNVKYKVELK